MSKNPFSREAFLEWVERQSGPYDFMSMEECPIAQYGDFLGVDTTVICGSWTSEPLSRLHRDLVGIIGGCKERTYGALAERLRAAA